MRGDLVKLHSGADPPLNRMLRSAPIHASLAGLLPERKPRLLLVDDEPINIQVMHRVFAQDCQVFMATSGSQALEITEKQMPDLILLDIEMPGMDGFEVCRRLQASEWGRGVPIIFVTGHSDPAQETQGLELGAMDFISKPINPSVLRARARTQLLLKSQSDVLRDMVFRDGLTGVSNRRYFDQQLELEWARATRHASPLSLLILDVDSFKRYNDHYGHQAGDQVLREIGTVLKSGLKRSTDIVARYGGEEFVCLLPDTPHEQARQLAEDIEQRVRLRALPHEASDVCPVITVSVGVATGEGRQGQAQDLLSLADQQLYQAKRNGRARVCSAMLQSAPQAPRS